MFSKHDRKRKTVLRYANGGFLFHTEKSGSSVPLFSVGFNLESCFREVLKILYFSIKETAGG